MTTQKQACLAYLDDCEYNVAIEPYAVQSNNPGDEGPDDNAEPCVSWGDLSDIIAPRD